MNSRARFLSSSTFVLPPSRLLPCYACVEGARKAGAAKPEDDGNWTHRLGNAPHFFAAINITHPPSLMSRANPHHQNVKNTDHHQSARKAIRLLPTPRRRGWEESIRVYARARACVACLTKPSLHLVPLLTRKVQKSQKIHKTLNETKTNDTANGMGKNDPS